MAQGLSNAPLTFNRLVTQLIRPHRDYAQIYFDEIFFHRRAAQVCLMWRITMAIIASGARVHAHN